MRTRTLVIAMHVIPLPQLVWARWPHFAHPGEVTKCSQRDAWSDRWSSQDCV